MTCCSTPPGPGSPHWLRAFSPAGYGRAQSPTHGYRDRRNRSSREQRHVSHTFQVDLRGVVDLLSHHLYGSPRVYVRELLQNAVDAITARQVDDPQAPAQVLI